MLDMFGRPDWDSYYMAMCMLITTRSIDPRTKHSCILTDSSHRLLSMGYNGPLRGSIDENVPLEPPLKYLAIEHGERNAIYNSNNSLEGSTAYVTGYPCIDCFRGLIQKGVKRIVWGPIVTHMATDENDKVIQQMLIGQNVEFVKYEGDFWEVFDVMEKYLKTKDIERQ